MKIVVLDAKMLGEKKQAHAYLKEVFGFPAYYGKNLDALHDCLTDIFDLKIAIRNAEQAGPYFLRVYPLLVEDADVFLIH